MRPLTWSRPKPLLSVAGHTVLGHLLDMMADITTDEVIFVVGYKGDEIEAWIKEYYPDLVSRFVLQPEALGQAHAIWQCRDYLDDSEVLIAFGDGVVEADYMSINHTDADAVCLVQEVDDPRKFGVVAVDDDGYVTEFIEKPDNMAHKLAIAGIYWFRNGRLLRQALEKVITDNRQTNGEFYLADAYQILLAQGVRIATKPVTLWLDAGNPENVLETNARLLSLGYASEDAIERSYAEDFTVLPPVFIHESAVVEAAVVGPYVNIEAGAVVRQAIIRNSIIEAGACVENCVLENAIVGRRAVVRGRFQSCFISDDSTVEW
ncbi:MAG: nucleotidyltransferase [Chloroflexi bacterium]|nr:MAG: nucleotidyltransferase [Chloroflexota bacterium]